MAIVRMRKEEMKLIVDIAEKMANRMNSRFVVDSQKVEIVEDDIPADAQADLPSRKLDLR